LRVWDADKEVTLKLDVGTILNGSNLVYETNGFVVLTASTKPMIPEEYFLSESYPNPFNSFMRLSYGLPEATRVSIRVYDISGRMVTSLFEDDQTAGYHTIIWNCGDTATGVYLIRMESTGFNAIRKVALVK